MGVLLANPFILASLCRLRAVRIAVVLHERDAHAASVGYVLWAAADVWRAAGHTVTVHRGVGPPLDADVVFLHVDLTVIPAPYLNAVAGHPHVVNRSVVDISKTVFSHNRVTDPAGWDGPVIVKTVRNHGGKPERQLEDRGLTGGVRDFLAKRELLPLAYTDWIDPYRYPIFPSAAAVPAGVYRNSALFVERFLPERRGELFGLRSYSFLGDRAVGELYLSPFPVVKRRDAVEWTDVDTPDEIVEMRSQLKFDYGKFDYVLHDGRPVLLDVNRTPAFGHAPERLRRQGEALAPGIEAFAR